jgi:hypothetical protein
MRFCSDTRCPAAAGVIRPVMLTDWPIMMLEGAEIVTRYLRLPLASAPWAVPTTSNNAMSTRTSLRMWHPFKRSEESADYGSCEGA